MVTGSSLEEAQQQTGAHRNTLRLIEHGLSDPRDATLKRILSGYGVRPEMHQPMLDVFQRLSDLLTGAEPPEQPVPPRSADDGPPRPAAGTPLDELLAHPLPVDEDHPSLAHPDPADQLSRLMAFSPGVRLLFANTAAEFHSERLALHVCDSSYAAAERGLLDRAAELSDLAFAIAALTERDPAALRAYARAHEGYARSLQNRLEEAGSAFAEAAKLWDSSSKPTGLVGRRLTLEASLHLAERRPCEALALLAQAAAAGDEPGRALLEIAAIEEALGHPERALEALDRAAALLLDPPLRQRFLLLYLRGLCNLEQPGHALAYSEEAITLAARLDTRADVLRALWLHAKVTAALGQNLLAEDLFQLLRFEFRSDASLHYDLAIVSLELAALLLETSSSHDADALSVELRESFALLDVHPEAAAALQRFSSDLGRGVASPITAHHLAAYLYRARHDRSLRFSPSEPTARPNR